MLDRIRANPTGTYAPVTLAAEPATAANCYTTDCNIAAMAVFDISSWKCQLNSIDSDDDTYDICTTLGIVSSLPEGAGAVSLAGTIYAVEVQWVDDRQGNTKSVILRSAL
jgi:hypothetical protein